MKRKDEIGVHPLCLCGCGNTFGGWNERGGYQCDACGLKQCRDCVDDETEGIQPNWRGYGLDLCPDCRLSMAITWLHDEEAKAENLRNENVFLRASLMVALNNISSPDFVRGYIEEVLNQSEHTETVTINATIGVNP